MHSFHPSDFIPGKSRLRYFGGHAFTRFIMHSMRLKKLNRLYTELDKTSGVEFIEQLFKSLDFCYELADNELNKLHLNGGFITVSNHPFGGLDGMILIKILAELRPDMKILVNEFLQRIKPLNQYFLGINPLENEAGDTSSPVQLKHAIEHVQNGGVLSIFPAGEVSSFDNYYNIADREWQYSIIKLIKTADVPVVPIYFNGANSRLFHILGMIHPRLRQIKLPSELLNKKHKRVSVRIGSPIRAAEIRGMNDINQLGRFLRAKTYSLGASNKLEVRKFFKNRFKKVANPEELVPAVEPKLILQELESIKLDYTLFSVKNYTVYCAPSKLIPNILNEIGRLREVTFRLVGEGTNHSIDLDEYDLYYNQLFIWDEETNRMVGAYRIGLGADIIQQYGVHGFYLQSLFRIKKQFASVLSQSLELGRSFVVPDYQRKPLPLFLLWKGILYFLLKNPEYRYLLGPVSISNNYSPASKDSIIKFITTYYLQNEMAKNVRPRKAYSFVSENPSINLLLENVGNDLNKFDRIIGDIDKVNNGIPVLLKKYLSLNAKICAFNVDPQFNNCLDGLIVLDVYEIPQSTIESLSKEVNDGSILERFYSSRELVGG